MQRGEPLRRHPACFGCSPYNPAGLRLQPFRDGERVWARWRPERRFRGYPGVSHGGIVAAVLDELMGWVIVVLDEPPHATVELTTRFRAPTRLEEPHLVEAWPVERRGRSIRLTSRMLREADGTLVAEGEATFLRIPEPALAHFGVAEVEPKRPR